jgi:hypothetical protein
MPSRRWLDRARSWAEEITAGGVAGLLLWSWPYISARFSTPSGWSSSGLYSAVFSWTSIQIGFLFAVYTFVVPRTEPLFKAVSGTGAFESFKRYMLLSTYLTLLCALGAFILMVTNPVPNAAPLVRFPLIGWMTFTAYTLFRFLKVIRSFRGLERTRHP